MVYCVTVVSNTLHCLIVVACRRISLFREVSVTSFFYDWLLPGLVWWTEQRCLNEQYSLALV